MTTDRKPGEIPSLTGLRGVAALLVIITHYWFWARVTPAAALPSSVEPWTATSDIGMAIFFTLSGFVIALSYSHWNWRDRPIFNLVRLFLCLRHMPGRGEVAADEQPALDFFVVGDVQLHQL